MTMHKCDGCRYKGEHHEMMFRPMGVCKRGANLLEAVQNYEAEKCPYQRTNADRIRAMTDEELAHELAKVAGWDRKEYEKAKRIGIEKVILDILKQPAEMEKTT